MYSELFNCNCCKISFDTFMFQLINVMGEIIPRKAALKYLGKPISLITINFDKEIAPKFLKCFTIEEMRLLFETLSPEEKHHIIMELQILELSFKNVPKDALVCVPDLPKDYVKPFFLHLFTPTNILVKLNDQ